MNVNMNVIFKIFELKGSIDSIYYLSQSSMEVNESVIDEIKEKVDSIVNDIRVSDEDGTAN